MQEYWSGLPFPSPGDLPNPGIEPGSPALQADFFTTKPPGKPRLSVIRDQMDPDEHSGNLSMRSENLDPEGLSGF